MKLSKETIFINSKKITYRTIGPLNGEPLVFIHGLSGSSIWWRRNIAELSQEYRIYLIDLPGFGSMRGLFGRIGLEKIAAWIVELLRVLNIKKAHFIGHSMGGYVCITLASEYPQVVNKLVLVSSVGIPHGLGIRTSVFPLLLAVLYVSPRFLPILMYDVFRAGPFSIGFSALEIFKANARDKLKKIKAKTLLLWGANDTLIPVTCGYEMQKVIKHSRLVIFRYASHVPMYDEPEHFNKTVKAFLSK